MMERKAPLDDDIYWGNVFMLLFVTWAVLLYIMRPEFVGAEIPPYGLLLILVISGYSLLLFNQTEILRKRVEALEDER